MASAIAGVTGPHFLGEPVPFPFFHKGIQLIHLHSIQMEIMQQILSQRFSMLTSQLLPVGNGIFLVSGDTSGAAQTASLSQYLKSIHHLLLASTQTKEEPAPVLGEGLATSIAPEKLGALLAVASVANDVVFAPQAIVAARFIGAEELAGIHRRHLLH